MVPSYPSTEASLVEYYNQHWYMDSEATSHVIGQKASLELLHDGNPNYNISIVDRATH